MRLGGGGSGARAAGAAGPAAAVQCSTSGRCQPPIVAWAPRGRPEGAQQGGHTAGAASRSRRATCWRPPAPAAAALPAPRQSQPTVARAAAAPSSSGSGSSAAGADAAFLKQQLREAVDGIDRGIFGVQSAKRQQVAALVEALEATNPLQQPTAHLDQVAGRWRLLYTTITIAGVKKTKLGLREFVKLGEFEQHIDVDAALALNVISFSVAGLGMLSGSLTVKAAYEPLSDRRVAIRFLESTLVPEQLQRLFQQNYDLLLSIFNPDGWLDITYVDGELRCGRDDKGNIFVLERVAG